MSNQAFNRFWSLHTFQRVVLALCWRLFLLVYAGVGVGALIVVFLIESQFFTQITHDPRLAYIIAGILECAKVGTSVIKQALGIAKRVSKIRVSGLFQGLTAIFQVALIVLSLICSVMVVTSYLEGVEQPALPRVFNKSPTRMPRGYTETLSAAHPLVSSAIAQIVIFGKASVTAATVAALLEKEIEICYLTQHGRYIGRILPEVSKNVLLRREQYRAAFDDARTLRLAQGFVNGKLANMTTILRRVARREPTFADCDKAADRIKTALDKAKKAKDVDQVRGYEGEGSAAYFSVFGALIKSAEFTFKTRERRPPTDPVNALLSFGYTLLMNELFAAVNVVGFDPYIGYLHADKYGRPSLPLDLMEEFRPVFVDSIVLSCLNNHILSRSDFREEMGQVFLLTDQGRKTFLKHYEERKQSEFLHPVLNQKITYQHCFEHQTRFLAKTLQGELNEYPPLLVK